MGFGQGDAGFSEGLLPTWEQQLAVLEQQRTLSPSSRLSNALTFADITYPVLSLSATIEHIEQPELKIVRKQLGTSTEAWSLKQAVRSIVQLAFPHGSTSLLHTKIIPRPQQANL